MFEMSLENVMGLAFEQCARGQGRTMAFSFDVSASAYNPKRECRRRQSIHFLLYGVSKSGSVRTFFAEDENCFMKARNIPCERWENVSNHDSCWRDAIRSKVNEVYFRMCDEVNEDRVRLGLEKIAPVSMHTMAHVPMFENLFEILEDVEYERDYEAEEHHFGTRWKVRKKGDADIRDSHLSRGNHGNDADDSGSETASSLAALQVASIPRA